jgi:two-component system chemotaxis response regulator CheY
MKTGDRDIPILIVDDYKTMLRVVRKLLAAIGFENVEEAGDGPSALALLRRKPFRLVISDWNMAPMTGLELLQEVRADRALCELPFVIMTADNSAEQCRHLAAGNRDDAGRVPPRIDMRRRAVLRGGLTG